MVKSRISLSSVQENDFYYNFKCRLNSHNVSQIDKIILLKQNCLTCAPNEIPNRPAHPHILIKALVFVRRKFASIAIIA